MRQTVVSQHGLEAIPRYNEGEKPWLGVGKGYSSYHSGATWWIENQLNPARGYRYSLGPYSRKIY